MICYKAEAVSRNDIRRYVRIIRKRVGLEYQLYVPILYFVENILPILIPDFQFEVVPVAEMGNKHGETYPSRRLIRIREDIYLGAVREKPRDRMTIAHEVGHLFLHESDSVALCRISSQDRLKPYEDPEWQADAFGGEFLAPSYLIKGMDVLNVQRSCGVSAAAAFVQLKNIRNY